MRLTVYVSGLRVGDYLIATKRTVTGLGIVWNNKRTIETTRESGYVSTAVWNEATTVTVERSGETPDA